MIEAVFFDLDGTLADTAPDLAFAINQVLIGEKKRPLDYQKIRPFVSGGSPALIKLGFDIDHTHDEFERLKNLFLSCYAKNIFRETLLFLGIKECLQQLTDRGIPWGIITNKPDFLTQPLVEKLGIKTNASTIISGDTYALKKPDPYPLIMACEITGTSPKNCVYVGDDERDMLAAKSANMIAICAEWGYLSNQNPLQWDVDHYVKKSSELSDLLFNLISASR